MQEIRCRAWDKDSKRMLDVDALYFDKNGKLESIVLTREAEPPSYRPVFTRLGADDIILMQSTGLKDKHGVLIYEGDIVHITTVDTKATVVWSSSDCAVNLEPVDKKWKTVASRYSLGKHLKICEVVGNIYENADLLEDKNGN